MDKTLGQIGREAYEAKWRELCPELYHEPFDPGRDCSANGDVADEACAAAVIEHFEASQALTREEAKQAGWVLGFAPRYSTRWEEMFWDTDAMKWVIHPEVKYSDLFVTAFRRLPPAPKGGAA